MGRIACNFESTIWRGVLKPWLKSSSTISIRRQRISPLMKWSDNGENRRLRFRREQLMSSPRSWKGKQFHNYHEQRCMGNELTVPGRILSCAAELDRERGTFTAEDLVVRCWERFPDTFGLQGYADKHPDSNRVLTNIMGTKGMRGKGWLRKVGEKQYRLTSAGLSDGETLIERGTCEIPAGEPTQMRYLRAELDRQTASALDRLVSTGG